jgi:hypothetical protein
MLRRLNELSTRGKAIMTAVILVLTPVAIWAGYHAGYMLGHQ